MRFSKLNIGVSCLLSALLRGDPPRGVVDGLVLLCQKIAPVQLHRRFRTLMYCALAAQLLSAGLVSSRQISRPTPDQTVKTHRLTIQHPPHPPPRATLSADRTVVSVFETVTFSVSVEGAKPDPGFVFRFGDGSSDESTSHSTVRRSFRNPGNFAVRVTVQHDIEGPDMIFDSNVIEVTVDSVLLLTPDVIPVNASAQLSVRFHDPDGSVHYRFNYGDGSANTVWSSSPETTHRYLQAGTYWPYAQIGRGGDPITRTRTRRLVVVEPDPVDSLPDGPSSVVDTPPDASVPPKPTLPPLVITLVAVPPSASVGDSILLRATVEPPLPALRYQFRTIGAASSRGVGSDGIVVTYPDSGSYVASVIAFRNGQAVGSASVSIPIAQSIARAEKSPTDRFWPILLAIASSLAVASYGARRWVPKTVRCRMVPGALTVSDAGNSSAAIRIDFRPDHRPLISVDRADHNRSLIERKDRDE